MVASANVPVPPLHMPEDQVPVALPLIATGEVPQVVYGPPALATGRALTVTVMLSAEAGQGALLIVQVRV